MKGDSMIQGTIRAVYLSEKKGTGKKPVAEAHFIEDLGIGGDAHAGHWHRQVSLLSYEKVRKFNESGAGVTDGDFGENLVVSGIDFRSLPVGTILAITSPDGKEEAVLEMTQIGKECHNGCAIRQRMGVCIMPVEGVFAKVARGGYVHPGDLMTVRLPDPDRPFTAAVITVSDRSAAGVREDKSGPAAREILEKAGYQVLETIVIPDEPEEIKKQLMRLSDQRQVSLISTSGGTGFSMRDNTPEATMAVADRNAPGIAEAIIMKSLQITDRAMLTRLASVIRKKTLIVNLPGSPKAVREDLGFILGALEHGLGILRGSATD